MLQTSHVQSPHMSCHLFRATNSDLASGRFELIHKTCLIDSFKSLRKLIDRVNSVELNKKLEMEDIKHRNGDGYQT